MSIRRLSAVVAAAAIPIVMLTGCAPTQTAGRVATAGSGSACVQSGNSAAAAGTTVHCYLAAVSTSDTRTACALLSERVRAALASSAADRFDDPDSAISVPTGGAGVTDSECATVAPVMQRALDQLSAADLDELRAAVAGARIGQAQVSGSAATVTVTMTAAGRSATDDIDLTQEDGGWKIDSTSAFTVGS